MERRTSEFRPLEATRAPEGTCLQLPTSYVAVTAESPAIFVMTDLRQVSAATIRREASLAEATRAMIARGVRLLLVVDAGERVVGLITARDTQGERPVQRLHDRGGRYADLRVEDLMIPREDIDILDLRDVLHAHVGHIVATLKAWGRQHALVGERDIESGAMKIRGIFSATQIGRQLGIALQPFEVARTFSEIEQALAD